MGKEGGGGEVGCSLVQELGELGGGREGGVQGHGGDGGGAEDGEVGAGDVLVGREEGGPEGSWGEGGFPGEGGGLWLFRGHCRWVGLNLGN